MSVNFYNKMGSLTIRQTRNNVSKDFHIDIWNGNCLAVFNYEYKDENGRDMISLYMFFADKQHVKNIINNSGSIFGDEVVGTIKLNLFYKEAKPLIDIFVKEGYRVECYYEKPETKKK